MQRRIRQVELLTGDGRILNLQNRMPPGLTERAETLLRGKHVTRRSPDAANYVRHHLPNLSASKERRSSVTADGKSDKSAPCETVPKQQDSSRFPSGAFPAYASPCSDPVFLFSKPRFLEVGLLVDTAAPL